MASTFTFHPQLFDEQCLSRFLEIESEPDRQDLAFLLERESRLGDTYAGILVDHTWAGVEHSMRWDVLPVRIRNGKQHAKLSLLAWEKHVRIIVSSANLTEPGYRVNREVACAVDLSPVEANLDLLTETLEFLRALLEFVPGAALGVPEVTRAADFLKAVEQRTGGWARLRRGQTVRQRLVCTLPATATGAARRSSLDEVIQICRGRGASPWKAWIASPFFDVDEDQNAAAAALCKQMARGAQREMHIAVPAIEDVDGHGVPRLGAPKSLLTTPMASSADVSIQLLPNLDDDSNFRPWHAKMMALQGDKYLALMAGSSNFTRAGLGIGSVGNAEANLVTIVDHTEFGRERGQLAAVWPDMDALEDAEDAEWLGASDLAAGDESAGGIPLPAGFVSATYRAGGQRQIVLRLEAGELPEDWSVSANGTEQCMLLNHEEWTARGHPSVASVIWKANYPPDKLIVRWGEDEAFWTINVEDAKELPAPPQVESMTAEDMLLILAASDPSAAFCAWAERQQPSDLVDPELDLAVPIDLNPLQRYDLQATFLHRVRRRARVLANLRANLERPVWSAQALDWRLRGMIGIAPLAARLADEFCQAVDDSDEKLLTIADLLIVLREVDYQEDDGSLSRGEFKKAYVAFLKELAASLDEKVRSKPGSLSGELADFWNRVCTKCQA